MAQFDPSVPSIARVYDFFLGGKDNFAADRALAEEQVAFAPLIPLLAKENRQFLARAVTWAAQEGITQFIDLGCGMPTAPNTHESARAVIPDARVAYVDNDPVVLSHLNALVAKGNPGITVVDGDAREPAAILSALAGGVDLTEPACLIMGYLLHFSSPSAARDLVASYAAALAPGSCVVISVVRADRADADESFGGYSRSVTQVYNHSPADFASFVGPLELVPPGAVDARQWCPGWEDGISLKKRDGHVMAAVARVSRPLPLSSEHHGPTTGEGHAQVIGTSQQTGPYPTADPGTGAARDLIRRAQDLSAALGGALAAPGLRKQEAQHAYGALRKEAAADELARMPLERIKDVTHGRLMLTALEQAGFRTVGSVLTAGPSALDTVPGIGPQTAAQVVAAARQIAAALAGTVTVRIDPDNRTIQQASLLGALHAYERAQANVPPRAPDPAPLKDELDAAVAQAGPAGSRLRMFFSGAGRKQAARDGLARLHAVLGSAEAAEATARLRPGAPPALTARAPDPTTLWNDFLARPVAYNGLLVDVAGLGPDQESAEGFLPAEIAERVRDQPLDLSLVTASLRGYQAFGAKFALAQRRVIIGDEMGLGKTVQALSAMAHLAATAEAAAGGGTAAAVHFLVVCPASVVVNWIREITKHTTLTAHKLHGPDRDQARQRWLAAGGVAVTTYEALRSLAAPGAALDPDGEGPAPAVPLAMMTVDEAHYAKNTAALRTRAVRAWANATAHVLFLTGTPMENRVEEFRTLVGHLRPDVAGTVKDVDGLLGGTRFRRTVAPVYLRRNQDDVLGELPPRLENDDWVELDGTALEAYREAVAEGNFMKMRRAAFAVGTGPGGAGAGPGAGDSRKLDRLIDIVEEATDDGRKVIVFSFFRTVLDTVMTALGDKALGPITGDVPPPQRQALVDEFTARTGPSVLVSQIQAGGVGLNIQAASVVIICEPQWNPAIEEQAIARAHRMGQVRRVDVHRLLAEHSVDQQMLELTAAKRAEFNEYARRSDLAAATPDAIDISDLTAVAEVASQTEAERRIVTAERERLGVASERQS